VNKNVWHFTSRDSPTLKESVPSQIKHRTSNHVASHRSCSHWLWFRLRSSKQFLRQHVFIHYPYTWLILARYVFYLIYFWSLSIIALLYLYLPFMSVGVYHVKSNLSCALQLLFSSHRSHSSHGHGIEQLYNCSAGCTSLSEQTLQQKNIPFNMTSSNMSFQDHQVDQPRFTEYLSCHWLFRRLPLQFCVTLSLSEVSH